MQPLFGRKHARVRRLLRCRRPPDASRRACSGAQKIKHPKLCKDQVTSLAAHVSRFTVFLKNLNKRTRLIIGKILTASKYSPLVNRQ